MSFERSVRTYRSWYAKLLRLYPKSYHERFGEGMEQTFNDLLRERGKENGLFGFALEIFAETLIGIIKERLTFVIMQNTTKRLSVWALVVGIILLTPLVLTLMNPNAGIYGGPGGGWDWSLSDFVIMGTVLSSLGLAYELIGRKLSQKAKGASKKVYRAAFVVGLLGAFLLFWVNGAVGIIGSDDNPANLLYGAVFVVGLFGSLIARFKPRGMAYTLFTAAVVQLSVPLFALFVWPAQTSWGAAGVNGVFVFNAIFAVIFAASGMLFLSAAFVPKEKITPEQRSA